MGIPLTSSGTFRRSLLPVLAALVAPAAWASPIVQSGDVRIASYNVENYLRMPRRIDGKLVTDAGKPESEKKAVALMIASIHPDVLGLMEIGDPSQRDDLLRRLHQQGLDYSGIDCLEAADTTRHLLLLSRLPIVERHSLGDIPLRVNGVTVHSPRGIIDVTVETAPGKRLRILCVHLKAKLDVAEYDQGDLRDAESEFLRRHVRDILASDPATRLVLMGDFNDTKNEKSIWRILGKPEWPDSLTALPLADARGEFWTEYWTAADIYSRIDYIMVSKKLESEIDPAQSGIARPPFWNEASDHCPVYMTLRNTPTPSQATP